MKPAQKIRKILDGPMLCQMLCMMFCILYIMADTVCAAVLRIDRQSAGTGEKISFAVSAADVPNAVNALGFEVKYDASVLRFRGFVPGSLTQGFTNFSASNTDFGTVRIGGFDAGENQISQGVSGVLVSLEFEVVAEKSCDVQIQNLLDDVKDWSVTTGSFSGNSEENDEEINADDTEKADADTENQSESGQNAANADLALSAEIAMNPLGKAHSSDDRSAFYSDTAGENRETAIPETGKTGQGREKLREKQGGERLSADRHSMKSQDAEKNTGVEILESEKKQISGLSSIHTEQQSVKAVAEMKNPAENAEKGNSSLTAWHWMIFGILVLILVIQVLILWQVRRLIPILH